MCGGALKSKSDIWESLQSTPKCRSSTLMHRHTSPTTQPTMRKCIHLIHNMHQCTQNSPLTKSTSRQSDKCSSTTFPPAANRQSQPSAPTIHHHLLKRCSHRFPSTTSGMS